MFDIHCHILPGVDDGSKDLKQSKRMLLAAQRAGITGMVCTPHCRGRRFDYQLIRQRYEELHRFSDQMGMRMDLGFEVYWEKLLELGLDKAPQLALGESGMLLLELGYASFPPRMGELVKRLQNQGLRVIIAHPERYVPVQKNIDKARALKDMGCYLQLSGSFMTDGKRGPQYRTATALLREGLVDYVASDAHAPEDYALFSRALAYARKTS